jgi:tetratricopeptide (TPR) repeat protein
MAHDLKQFAQYAAIALLTVLGSTKAGIAIESQDIKARLLADIGFQYAELGESQRSIEVLEQALRSTKAMSSRCFQGNLLAKIGGGYLLAGQETQGKQLLTEAIQTARAQEATRCSGSATSPTESLLNRTKEYADAGHFDLALELGQRLGDPMTLAELAGYLSAAGQPERATKVLNQAIDRAESLTNQTDRTQMLVVMAERLHQRGQHREQASVVLKRALESLNANPAPSKPVPSKPAPFSAKFSAESLQVSSTLRIARVFAAIGEKQQAIEVLNQVVPKIRTLASQPLPLDRVGYQIDAALQYGELGEKSQSGDLLAEALAGVQGIPRDGSSNREYAVAKIAEGYAKLGDFEQALQLAQAIPIASQRSAALGQIAIAYAKAGNLDAGVKLAQSIGNRNAMLIEVVRYHLTNKQPDQAWHLVQTHQVEGILSEVAVGFVEAGQPEKALQIVQTGNLQGFMPDIALSYAKVGQTDQALQLVTNQQMEWLLPAIARGFAQQGQLDSALQVTQSMNDKNYKAQALIAIAQIYTKPDAAEQGSIQAMLANPMALIRSLFGDSEREKAAKKVLEQALQVTQSY